MPRLVIFFHVTLIAVDLNSLLWNNIRGEGKGERALWSGGLIFALKWIHVGGEMSRDGAGAMFFINTKYKSNKFALFFVVRHITNKNSHHFFFSSTSRFKCTWNAVHYELYAMNFMKPDLQFGWNICTSNKQIMGFSIRENYWGLKTSWLKKIWHYQLSILSWANLA